MLKKYHYTWYKCSCVRLFVHVLLLRQTTPYTCPFQRLGKSRTLKVTTDQVAAKDIFTEKIKQTGQHININPTFQQQQSTTLIIKHLTTRTKRENITLEDSPKLFIRSFVDCLRPFVSCRSLPVVLVLSCLSSKLTAVYYLTTRVIYLSQN